MTGHYFNYNQYHKTSELVDRFLKLHDHAIKEVSIYRDATNAVDKIELTLTTSEAKTEWKHIVDAMNAGIIPREAALNSVKKFIDERSKRTLPNYAKNYLENDLGLSRWSFTRRIDVDKVIFNGPATIIQWKDGSKTVVKCMEGDVYDPEKAVMMATMEKIFGSKAKLKKWLKEMTQYADIYIEAPETVNTPVDEPKEKVPMTNAATDPRNAAFRKFVLNWANEEEQPFFVICGLIANKLLYTRETVRKWFNGGTLISDTAWKKLCQVWPELDQY